MGVGGKGKKGTQMRAVQKPQKVQVTNAAAGEKRMDPSDGNGPFNHASFLRFHGEKQGEILWKKAGKFQDGGNGVGPSQKKAGGKGAHQSQNLFSRAQNNISSKGKGGSKGFSSGKKGTGKKGDGKGNGKKGKGGAEKRIDPSDGNGPFTQESFIRFHGDEAGLDLWEQAGLVLLEEAPEEDEEMMDEEDDVGNGHFPAGNAGNGHNGKSSGKKGGGKAGKAGKKGSKKGKDGGKDGGKKQAEKRLDPSDGNGPFTLESFIRFHGQEAGDDLWEQAGAQMAEMEEGEEEVEELLDTMIDEEEEE